MLFPTAPVERGPSQGARSGSKGTAWRTSSLSPLTRPPTLSSSACVLSGLDGYKLFAEPTMNPAQFV